MLAGCKLTPTYFFSEFEYECEIFPVVIFKVINETNLNYEVKTMILGDFL